MSRKTFLILLSFLIVPGIGLLDQLSGDDLSLIVLYLVPIILASWQGGRLWGLLVAALAIASWSVSNLALPIHVDLDPSFQHTWDLIEKLIFFALAALSASRMKSYVEAERRKGLVDFATGLPNRRAFVADLAARAGKGPFEVGFIELDGLENLYLERGEAFVEALFKSTAGLCRAVLPTYRFGDERLAFIAAGMSGPAAAASMDRLAERIERHLLEAGAPNLRLKVGVARCPDSEAPSYPSIRKFLEGSMIYLRGKPGNRIETFDFAKV